ncbi:phospholipase A and acyltransferase 4-like [Ptychodera flava]|uniref:phospholipase A and acyltransferase 4-like n=1 Tax=Ptychodera flava TaxID=63121 RepID=UPI003969DB4F
MSALSRSGSGSYDRHNQTVLDSCNPGDLLEFNRGFISHWGVYVGEEQVVHLTGESGSEDTIGGSQYVFSVWGKQFTKAKVKRENFWDIVKDCKAKINNYSDRRECPASAEEIVERALSKLGRIGYNVLWNNCEHFAKWCRYGKEESSQVDGVLMGLGVAGAVGAVAGLLYAVTGREKERTQKK